MNENPEKITAIDVILAIFKIVGAIALIFLMFAFSPFAALFGRSDDDNL
jgi:hypothetical protein